MNPQIKDLTSLKTTKKMKALILKKLPCPLLKELNSMISTKFLDVKPIEHIVISFLPTVKKITVSKSLREFEELLK